MREFLNNEAFKERFEFKLSFGDNIVCQRYFKIENFKPASLASYELAETIRDLAESIDKDLKEKTATYLEIVAPMCFRNEEEMNAYFSDEENCKRMRGGMGIVVKDNPKNDFFWYQNIDKNGNLIGEPEVRPLATKVEDADLYRPLRDEDRVTFKLSFLVDEREVCSTIWDGVYPKYVRNTIDLSNKRLEMRNVNPLTVGFEQYINYNMYVGRQDLNYRIIRELQRVCSRFGQSYTTSDTYKGKNGKKIVYKNTVSNE